YRLDPWLEEERLAHRRQEAGQECRTVAAPRCRAEAARGALALDQGPRWARRKRARRSAGARGHRDGEVEGVGWVERSETHHHAPRVVAFASLYPPYKPWLTTAPAAYRRRTPRPCRARARG